MLTTAHTIARRLLLLLIAASLSCIVLGQTVSAATGQLELTVVDKDTGKPVACRMHIIGPKKNPFKPGKVPFWHDHFAVPAKILLKLPLGDYNFVIERGPEYLDWTGHFTIEAFADDKKQIEMQRFIDMAADGWWSGDLDVRRPAATSSCSCRPTTSTWPKSSLGGTIRTPGPTARPSSRSSASTAIATTARWRARRRGRSRSCCCSICRRR